MSSVFHEIISYMSRPERTKVLKQIYRNLKKDGKLIIRDWANNNSDKLYKIKYEKVKKLVKRSIDGLKNLKKIQLYKILKRLIIKNTKLQKKKLTKLYFMQFGAYNHLKEKVKKNTIFKIIQKSGYLSH